jgi:hypothetical protein
VKVGDRAFAKTLDTAALLEAAEPGAWSHVLLVPSWDAAQARLETIREPPIVVRVWDDVAIALRAALWRGEESMNWIVWARAYCGAIEQRLLGLPSTKAGLKPVSAGELAWHMIAARRLAEEKP